MSSSEARYIGLGAEKAGTTWIHSLIRKHPEVESADKELKHFVDVFRSSSPSEAIQSYEKRYSASSGLIQGEWTPRYMFDFWAPSMLAKTEMEARYLVSLRDPLARMRSGLTHSVNQKLANVVWMVNDAFYKSLYASQLERIVDALGAKKLFVFQYEAFVNDPLKWLRRIYEFVGCRQIDFAPDGLTQRVNKTEGGHVDLPSFVEEQAVRAFERDASRLLSLFPFLDLDLWPSISQGTRTSPVGAQ